MAAAWPWLKPSITATLGLLDSPWPTGGEGPSALKRVHAGEGDRGGHSCQVCVSVWAAEASNILVCLVKLLRDQIGDGLHTAAADSSHIVRRVYKMPCKCGAASGL